jgi:hypothetical protein
VVVHQPYGAQHGSKVYRGEERCMMIESEFLCARKTSARNVVT